MSYDDGNADPLTLVEGWSERRGGWHFLSVGSSTRWHMSRRQRSYVHDGEVIEGVSSWRVQRRLFWGFTPDCQLTFAAKIKEVLDEKRELWPSELAKSAKRSPAMATDTIETGDELSIRVLPTGRVRTEWRKAVYASPSGLILFAANEADSARFARLDAARLLSVPSSRDRALTQFRLRAKKSNRTSASAG